jgi:hypothetical protein
MEPIVLVGAIIVMFGLWQELEPVTQRIVTAITASSITTKLTSTSHHTQPMSGWNARWTTG